MYVHVCMYMHCGVFAPCKNVWTTETAVSKQYRHQQNNEIMQPASGNGLVKTVSRRHNDVTLQ
jgi:hypothetical protein